MMTDRRALVLLCTVVILLSAGALTLTGADAVQATGDGSSGTADAASGIHIDPVDGDDSNDGLTADTAVKTLDRARELAEGVPIIVHGEIGIGTSDSPYTLEGETLQRADGYTGRLINVKNGAELTVRDTVMDGMGYEADGALIHTQQGTVNIEDGTVLRNNGYTAVAVWNGGGTLNMTGGEICGNDSPEDGGAILINNAEANITGGSIHDNSTEMSGGAIALLSGELNLGDAEIYDNVSEGTHTKTSYAGRSSYYGGGGAVYAEANSSDDATVTIEGTHIRGNTAAGVGGALLFYDGGQYNSIDATISGITAEDNAATDGDLLYIDRTQSSKDFPAVGLSGENAMDGDVALRFTDAETGPVLTIADGFSNSASIPITFTDAVPSGVFATGSAVTDDFTVEGYTVTETDGGLVVVEVEQVYIDPDNGSDANDGLTRETAVESLDRARQIAGDKPIIVCGEIEITKAMSPYVLEDANLQRAEGYTGRILYVMYGAELTVRDTVIDGMGYEADGVLIHTQQGRVTIEDGTILKDNGFTAITLANSGSVLIMNGGDISGNTSDSDGGAIHIYGGRMEMNGGSITGNSTSASGGAIALIGARLAMNGGEISNHSSTGTTVDTILGTNSQLPGGGAIYAETCKQGKAQVTITGGTIDDNTSLTDGGAILVFNGYMYGSKQETVLDISGGTISDNAADGDGDAVWIGYDDDALHIPAFDISGSPSISGDVFLFGTGTTGVQISVGEGFGPSDAISISFPEMPAYAFAVGTTDASAFTADGYMVMASEEGLCIQEMPEFDAIYINPDNGSDSNYGLTADTAVKSLDRARELAGDKPIIVCGVIEITKAVSPYVLEDANLQRAEGYTGRILYVMYGAELTVRNTTIDGMGYDAEGALIHSQQGKVTMEDGTILRDNGFTAVTMVNGGAAFTMNGGEISGNRSDSDGGAIYIRSGAKATLNGGTISGNTTSASGGAVCNLGATLIVNGTTISGNSSTGTTIDTIHGPNSALPGGGAIYAESNSQGAATVMITGGTITGNTAAANGGAIFDYHNRTTNVANTLTVSGGTISDNTADGDGDAVWIGSTDGAIRMPVFTMSGSPTVSGDVFLDGDGDSGIAITAGDGFDPAEPVTLSFPAKPGYAIVTGDAEASDFAVGEGYALAEGADGLIVGTSRTETGEDGATTTTETFGETDAEGNTVTTTVTSIRDPNGSLTGMTTDVGGISVTTSVVDGEAVTEIAESEDIDRMVSIAAGHMSSFTETDRVVSISADGQLDLSAESVSAIAAAGASLEVVSGGFNIGFDGITSDGDGASITVSGEPTLSDAQQSAIGDAYSFDITADIGFSNAVITVPYEAPTGMDPDTARVLYVAEDGATTEMKTYYLNGELTFETSHLSVYMVDIEPLNTPVDPDEPSEPDFPNVPIIPGGDDDPIVTPPSVVIEDGSDGLSTTETAIVVILGVLTAAAAVALIIGLRRS